ncbi:MAG: guanylate kinase [Proteobacteria bacterium]|nr:guanylate kinase [Pseudomonadota bacterium]
MTQGLLIMISAPSGAGKTSLVQSLLAQDAGLTVAVSHTTRARRSKEIDGLNYHFVDPNEFERMVGSDAFLEHAEVFGHRYGTSREAVAGQLTAGRDVILEIDYQGAAQVRSRLPATLSIFILPPSRATLKARLVARKQDDDDVIEHRFEKAVQEMSHHTDYDYLVVNDVFETAVTDLQAIIQAARLGITRQRERLKPLLVDLLSG